MKKLYDIDSNFVHQSIVSLSNKRVVYLVFLVVLLITLFYFNGIYNFWVGLFQFFVTYFISLWHENNHKTTATRLNKKSRVFCKLFHQPCCMFDKNDTFTKRDIIEIAISPYSKGIVIMKIITIVVVVLSIFSIAVGNMTLLFNSVYQYVFFKLSFIYGCGGDLSLVAQASEFSDDDTFVFGSESDRLSRKKSAGFNRLLIDN